MKKFIYGYWISTVIIALMMSFSAYSYLTQESMDQAFQHLGFPAWFRVELAVAKLLGVILLLAPVGTRLKEWTYAGFAIVFVSAFLAHLVSGDPVSAVIMPLVFLMLLVFSYTMYYQVSLRKKRIVLSAAVQQ